MATAFSLSACGRSDLSLPDVPLSVTDDAGPTPRPPARDSGPPPRSICTWSQRFGDEHTQFMTGLGTDSAGNTLITGVFRGVLEIGGERYDSRIVKDNGTIYGGAGLLAKLDPSGAVLWSRAFLPAQDPGSVQLAVDHQGNALVAAATQSPVDFGGGPIGPGLVLTKIDPNGKHVWSKVIANGQGHWFGVDGLAVDPQDDVVLWGIGGDVNSGWGLSLAKLDPSGGRMWEQRFATTGVTLQGSPHSPVVIDAAGTITVTAAAYNGGTITVGNDVLTIPDGGRNVLLARVDPVGVPISARLLTKTGNVEATYMLVPSLAVGPDGEAYVTVVFDAPVDVGTGLLTPSGKDGAILVARVDATGQAKWARVLGDGVFAEGLAVTPAGDLVMTGIVNGSIDFGGGPLTASGTAQPFLAKLEGATGKHVASHLFGPGVAAFDLLAVQPNDRVVIAGRLYDSLDLCHTTLYGAGQADFLVAELAP